VVESGMIVFSLAMCALAGVWARRNLRLGRGDRKGAWRLAIFTFASLALAQLSAADHTAMPIAEFSLLVLIAGQSLVGTFLVWLFYIALEPTVRRRWPHTLISWSRLLAGRFRDPLLGRDVLVGALAGMALVLALPLGLASLCLGRAPAMILAAPTPRLMAYVFFLSPWAGVFFSTGLLFILSLLQALVRRAWLARLLLSLPFLAQALEPGEDPLVAAVKGALLAAIIISVLVRFGLLSSATLLFTSTVLGHVTLTLDWSVWYARPSFALLGFYAALLVAAFYTSLGGKPLFGRALLED